MHDDAPKGFTIAAPVRSSALDRDATILALRLGLAVNAVRASHRHFLAVAEAPGPGGERDRLWAFLSAAAFVKEAMNILSGTRNAPAQKTQVEQLARRSGASDELVQTIDRLLAGTHPVSEIVTRVRNKLTFHWDPAAIGEWIDRYDEPHAMWFDASGGTSNGETLYRAAADSAAYSILLPTDAELALPLDERRRVIAERFKDALRELTGVMTTIQDYFERAIATFLRDAGATITRVDVDTPASDASNTGKTVSTDSRDEADLQQQVSRILEFRPRSSPDAQPPDDGTFDENLLHALLRVALEQLRKSMVNHQANLDEFVGFIDRLGAQGVNVSGNFREGAEQNRAEHAAGEQFLQFAEAAADILKKRPPDVAERLARLGAEHGYNVPGISDEEPHR